MLAIEEKCQVPLWKACALAVQQGSTSATKVSVSLTPKLRFSPGTLLSHIYVRNGEVFRKIRQRFIELTK